MWEQTGLFLAKSQWPGVSLRLSVIDIGSEISNWAFILPKLSFAITSPLCNYIRLLLQKDPRFQWCCAGTARVWDTGEVTYIW